MRTPVVYYGLENKSRIVLAGEPCVAGGLDGCAAGTEGVHLDMESGTEEGVQRGRNVFERRTPIGAQLGQEGVR